MAQDVLQKLQDRVNQTLETVEKLKQENQTLSAGRHALTEQLALAQKNLTALTVQYQKMQKEKERQDQDYQKRKVALRQKLETVLTKVATVEERLRNFT